MIRRLARCIREYKWATILSPVCMIGEVAMEVTIPMVMANLYDYGIKFQNMPYIARQSLLLVLCAIMVVVNMLFCFIGAKLFKCNLEDAIIASNANIGGPTTAAGMAISQGWTALVGPAMLVGVLGYVIGNYAGTLVGMILGA